jgi:hypothetical protein
MDLAIYKLKQSFAVEGEALIKSSIGLKAVFCIGSSANAADIPDRFYQDFDIHFYFDKSYLANSDLAAVRDMFNKAKASTETPDLAIDFCIMDKPWKMIPRKKLNIGMHGT